MIGRTMTARRLGAGAAVIWLGVAGLATLTGCGRAGELRPGPVFGRAKAAPAAGSDSGQQRTDQEPPGTDNAPRSTRQMQDPNQQNTPVSRAPIPGTTPDPFGPQPSVKPPNG